MRAGQQFSRPTRHVIYSRGLQFWTVKGTPGGHGELFREECREGGVALGNRWSRMLLPLRHACCLRQRVSLSLLEAPSFACRYLLFSSSKWSKTRPDFLGTPLRSEALLASADSYSLVRPEIQMARLIESGRELDRESTADNAAETYGLPTYWFRGFRVSIQIIFWHLCRRNGGGIMSGRPL